MTKAALRDNMKKTRDNLTVIEQKAYSNMIQKQLLGLEAYQQCTDIFIYVSFRSEVDTLAIIEDASHNKKRVYIPKVMEQEIIFYQFQDWNSLSISKFGILEPNETHKIYDFNNKTANHNKNIMLLPGLAFDCNGNRVGYGAGYYDRYLAANPNNDFIKIALAYDFQLVKELYPDIYDKSVDMIITPSKIIECR